MSIRVGSRVTVSDTFLSMNGKSGEVVKSGMHHVLRPEGAVWWSVRLDGEDGAHMFDASQLSEAV